MTLALRPPGAVFVWQTGWDRGLRGCLRVDREDVGAASTWRRTGWARSRSCVPASASSLDVLTKHSPFETPLGLPACACQVIVA